MNKNNFREYNQDQMLFTTVELNKLLPADHPARIINQIVETLNLESLYEKYSNEGNPSYHPKLMLKILFYGYYTDNMSCRKIWDNVIYRADFMYLAAGEVPNFRTINSFRTKHIDILPELFTQIVMMCKEMDLIGFENLAIDGESIKGNASLLKNKSKESLTKEYQKIRRGLRHLLEKEINEDFTEDYKKNIEEKLKKKMLKIESMQKELETVIEDVKKKDKKKIKIKRREKDYDKVKINMTDNDAMPLKHKDGRILPGYNQQSAVDGLYGVVCAIKTKNTPDHPGDLFEIIQSAEKNTENKFKHVLADCAFGNYENYERISNDKSGTEFFIPDERYSAKKNNEYINGEFDLEHFKKDKKGNLICPRGNQMEYKGIYKKLNTKVNVYKGQKCSECKDHKKCTKGKIRYVMIDVREKYQNEMRKKLDSDRGRIIYRKRQGIVEPVHGDDQKNKGWIQHHLRGIKKTKAEFILIRIVTNIGKIIKYAGVKMIINEKIKKYA